MKKSLVACLLASVLAVPAAAQEDPKAAWLLASVKAACRMPPALHPYSEAVLARFVGQVYHPEEKMLFTAFARGFTWTNSDNIPLAYCAGVFMNRPADPGWEPNLDLLGEARRRNALPPVQLKSVAEHGELTFGPLVAP